jgi:hypothetical protein
MKDSIGGLAYISLVNPFMSLFFGTLSPNNLWTPESGFELAYELPVTESLGNGGFLLDTWLLAS